MKITIDTVNDSHEDILKVIAFLSGWVDSKGSGVLSSSFSGSSPPLSSSGFGLADLFGGNVQNNQNSQQTPGSVSSASPSSSGASGAFDLHQMINNQEPDDKEEPPKEVKLDRYYSQ